MAFDEGEDIALRAEVNAMAILKTSCSIFSCSYCFSTCRSARISTSGVSA